MESVIISETVAKRIIELIDILYEIYEKGYFAIKANAQKYATDLKSFLYTVPRQQCYPTNKLRYGIWFCRYKPNKNTTWYITFDKKEEKWLIKNIFNNHSPDYATFLQSLKK